MSSPDALGLLGLLVIDGLEVRFENGEDGALRVLTPDGEIGRLELLPSAAGFVARLSSGDTLTKPSPWGGPVTARFGTRELGARALISRRYRSPSTA